jgi:hypothetical protein
MNKINHDFSIDNNDNKKPNSLLCLNKNQNNIYIDKNTVHYEFHASKFTNQQHLSIPSSKYSAYSKYIDHKRFKSHFLHMYGYTTAKFMPKNIYFKKALPLTKLLKQDDKLINIFHKILLNEEVAYKYNKRMLSEYESNRTYDLLIKNTSKQGLNNISVKPSDS